MIERHRGNRTNIHSGNVDGVTIAGIEAGGTESVRVFLGELAAPLRAGTYRPPPLRRVNIPEPGQPGEVLLTDLHNYGMPLIRYKVGDLASWKAGTCPCGRGLPLLNAVEGRTLDLISTPSGRVVSGVFFPHLLKDFSWIRTYQVIQEQPDLLTLRIAVDGPSPADQVHLLKETVARTLGSEMKVVWEMGEDVTIEQGRKFRPVVSHVPVDMSTAILD